MNTPQGISATDNLHFAAYLDASGKLTFAGCVSAGFGGKVLFRFRDPHGLMERIFEEYIAGSSVPAIDLSTSLRSLRRAMGSVSNSSNTAAEGQRHHVSKQP